MAVVSVEFAALDITLLMIKISKYIPLLLSIDGEPQ